MYTLDDFKVGEYVYLGVNPLKRGEGIVREIIDVDYRYNKVIFKNGKYHFDAITPKQIYDLQNPIKSYYSYNPNNM